MGITKTGSSQNPEITIQPSIHHNLFIDQALKITNPKHSTFSSVPQDFSLPQDWASSHQADGYGWVYRSPHQVGENILKPSSA